MLDKYQNVGWKKFYLIYGMCDETFSVNCTTEVPEGVDKGWFIFFVTLLNQIYWVGGATAGALLGYVIHFNMKGLEFVMTALFVVMFVNQWDDNDNNTGNHYDRSSCSRNNGNTLYTVYYLSGRKKSTGVCQISGDGSSLCGDRSSCDLLSQGCAGEQYSRAAGSNCNFIYRIDP